MKNLKLCNRRKIQQQEPHMIIQTDASTKGCGHTARVEMVKGREAFLHISSKITDIKVCNPNFYK